MESGLADKRVLVTGGSGGIGSACARAFSSEGAHVIVHCNSGRDRAEAVASEIGGDVVEADLTDERQVAAMFDCCGALDACAAVAGEWPREDLPVWELDLARWQRTLAVNLTGSFRTAGGFGRSLVAAGRRSGSLVFVGSTAGAFGEAGHSDYAAAKAGLVGLMLSLKNEIVRVAPLARVNAVFPGWTESPMTRGFVEDDQVLRVSRTMALRKVAQPEDVARQVLVLASDELSGHVTGQIVTVAGGMEGRVVHE